MMRVVHSSEDWSTNTDDPEINAFRELMASNEQYIGDPYVGIFWYDTRKQELFGVKSTLASDVDFQNTTLFDHSAKTCRPLHYQVWKREHYRGKDRRFQGDYTQIPRGRVFEVKEEGFVVCVGSWINDYPEAKEEILYEFELPEDTKFKIDSHWELGHGWSDKFL
jgi:hypothetical protein